LVLVEIAVCGLNHRSAAIDLLEKLAFTPEKRTSALAQLTSQSASPPWSFPEAVILATCNRVELYVALPDCGADAEGLAGFLAAFHGLALAEVAPSLYNYRGPDAVRHLLTVAAGIDSVVLGEPQILGQVRMAFEEARAQGAAGRVLSALFRQALETGKRVRSETGISRHFASVSSAAVEVAAGQFADLSACQVLIIGAGKTGRLAAQSLLRRGARRLAVANRSYENAQALAQGWGGEALSLDQVPGALAAADIVISCTNAPGYVVSAAQASEAVRARGGRPLLLVDIAVPRDIDPAAATLPGVRLINLDDLSCLVQTNIERRRDDTDKVLAIVEDGVGRFMAWFKALAVAPVITNLREQAESIRQREMARALRRLNGLPAEQIDIIEHLTQRIINQLLHEPTVQLKQHAGCEEGQAYAQTLCELFALDGSGHLE
jgi:glutamyl-tRNA reductase